MRPGHARFFFLVKHVACRVEEAFGCREMLGDETRRHVRNVDVANRALTIAQSCSWMTLEGKSKTIQKMV